MKKIFIISIAFITVVAVLLTGDRLFKLQHSNDDVFLLKDFTFRDSLHIHNAVVFTGRNVFGCQDAVIFPVSKGRDTFEYVYVRFSPEWFEENLSKKLKPASRQNADQYKLAKKICSMHMGDFWHINDFPNIVRDGYVPAVLKSRNGIRRFVDTI
jgi:hypothetical protein